MSAPRNDAENFDGDNMGAVENEDELSECSSKEGADANGDRLKHRKRAAWQLAVQNAQLPYSIES
jgi:hypothetical protein